MLPPQPSQDPTAPDLTCPHSRDRRSQSSPAPALRFPQLSANRCSSHTPSCRTIPSPVRPRYFPTEQQSPVSARDADIVDHCPAGAVHDLVHHRYRRVIVLRTKAHGDIPAHCVSIRDRLRKAEIEIRRCREDLIQFLDLVFK